MSNWIEKKIATHVIKRKSKKIDKEFDNIKNNVSLDDLESCLDELNCDGDRDGDSNGDGNGDGDGNSDNNDKTINEIDDNKLVDNKNIDVINDKTINVLVDNKLINNENNNEKNNNRRLITKRSSRRKVISQKSKGNELINETILIGTTSQLNVPKYCMRTMSLKKNDQKSQENQKKDIVGINNSNLENKSMSRTVSKRPQKIQSNRISEKIQQQQHQQQQHQQQSSSPPQHSNTHNQEIQPKTLHSLHVARIRNQLSSLQELADYFFCYAWMFERSASYVYIYDAIIATICIAASVLVANDLFVEYNCDDDLIIKFITKTISYFVAFLIGLNHFLKLPKLYKQYKEWAARCLNNYYEIKHWMINSKHERTYKEISSKMVEEYVILGKKSKPVSRWSKSALVKQFKDSGVQFPPIISVEKTKQVHNINLTPIIEDIIESNEIMFRKKRNNDSKKSIDRSISRALNEEKLHGKLNDDVDENTNETNETNKQSNNEDNNKIIEEPLIDNINYTSANHINESIINNSDSEYENKFITRNKSVNYPKVEDISRKYFANDPRIDYELSRLNDRCR